MAEKTELCRNCEKGGHLGTRTWYRQLGQDAGKTGCGVARNKEVGMARERWWDAEYCGDLLPYARFIFCVV